MRVKTSHPIDRLKQLPFSEQMDTIHHILQGQDVQEICKLIEHLQPSPDHEPLVHTLYELAQRPLFQEAALQKQLEKLFFTLPDTGIQRLLRLFEGQQLSKEHRSLLTSTIIHAWEQLPIERLAATCLMDRWLKHNATTQRLQHIEQHIQDMKQSLEQGRPEDITDTQLVFLPGQQLSHFLALAQKQGCAEKWQERLQTFSQKVLHQLQYTPRSLSQVNAEEILSRRVYTDPGHFLVELLQNAEDCGAHHFHIHLSDTHITIWHDGYPFDTRDVVGVLSIGQTTKTKEQIGFFGVGFKSIYEICERPQIYSDWYSFEIADISIPRPLAPTDEMPRAGTTLRLPYRTTLSESHSPEKLWERATHIPPETLLTLQHIKDYQVTFGSKKWKVVRQETSRPGFVELSLPEQNRSLHYFTLSQEYQYQATDQRESRKSTKTRILLAIALDKQGHAKALPKETPGIYSHLPTRERSGLKFLLHAHFDLPVDRERLHLDSLWNGWILSQVGSLLHQLVQNWYLQTAEELSVEQQASILDLLPLSSELSHPAYQVIPKALYQQLRMTPCLPSETDALLSPHQARIIESKDLYQALDGVSLDAQHATAWHTSHTRRKKVALQAGALHFTKQDLLKLLEQAFQKTIPGQNWGEEWLQEGLSTFLAFLLKEAKKETLLQLCTFLHLPDQHFHPQPYQALYRASEALRGLYGDARHFLYPAWDHQASPQQESFWRLLQLSKFTSQDLLQDLKEEAWAHTLLQQTSPLTLHQYLANQPRSDIKHLGTLPLFPDRAGQLHSIESTTGERLWLLPRGPFRDFLDTLEHPGLHFLEPTFSDALPHYLQFLGGQELTLERFIQWQQDTDERSLTQTQLTPLYGYLDTVVETLSHQTCQRLASAAFYPNNQGTLLPLVGKERALLAEDWSLTESFTSDAWLSEALRGYTFFSRLPAQRIGTTEIIRFLVSDEDNPLLDTSHPESLRTAHCYLLEKQEWLTQQERQQLAQASLWFDSQGKPRPLAQLQAPSSDIALLTLFEVFGQSFPIERHHENATWSIVQSLHLTGFLQPVDHYTLVQKLVGSSGENFSTPEYYTALHQALDKACDLLSPTQLAPLAQAPLFATTQGEYLPPGKWQVSSTERRAFRFQSAWTHFLAFTDIPLMKPSVQEDFDKLWPILGIQEPGPQTLLSLLQKEKTQRDQAACLAGRKLLIELQEYFPDTQEWKQALSALPLWPTRQGQWQSATEVFYPADCEEVLGKSIDALFGELPLPIMADEALEDAQKLASYIQFSSPIQLLVYQIHAQALPEQPLEEQTDFMNSVEKLIELQALLFEHIGSKAVQALPLALRWDKTLSATARLHTDQHTMVLLSDSELMDKLAHPEWARLSLTLSSELSPELHPFRLLQELSQKAKEHPADVFSSAEEREHFYQWCMHHRRFLEDNEQSLGLLGNTPLVYTAAGTYKAPKELWLDVQGDDFPEELGLTEWICHQELPQALRVWLHKIFQLQTQDKEKLLSILLDAYKEVPSQEDGPRSLQFIRLIARSFGESFTSNASQQLLKRHKCHRLKVQTQQGHFEQLHRVLHPKPEHRTLLEQGFTKLPLSTHSRYDEDQISAFFEACGAHTIATELETALESSEDIPKECKANIALARYTLLCLQKEPSLVQSLELDSRKWLLNTKEQPSSPAELYWPDTETQAFMGKTHDSYPHPDIVEAIPATVKELLAFQTVQNATLEDVLAQLPHATQEQQPFILEWLEIRLQKRSIDAQMVKEAFSDKAILRDEDGISRRTEELICTSAEPWLGDFLKLWPQGKRFAKLASVLDIPHRLRPKDLFPFFEQIKSELLASDGTSLLEQRPELQTQLPKCLAFLLTYADQLPEGSIPLLCYHSEDSLRYAVSLSSEPELYLPLPEKIFQQLQAHPKDLWFPALPEDSPNKSTDWLQKAGVPTLLELFIPEPFPDVLEREVNHFYPEKVEVLENYVQHWMGILSQNKESAQIHIVQELRTKGSILDFPLELEAEVVLEKVSQRLLITEVLLQGEDERLLVQLIHELGRYYDLSEQQKQAMKILDFQPAQEAEAIPKSLPKRSKKKQRKAHRQERKLTKKTKKSPQSPEDTPHTQQQTPQEAQETQESTQTGLWGRLKRWWNPKESAQSKEAPESKYPQDKETKEEKDPSDKNADHSTKDKSKNKSGFHSGRRRWKNPSRESEAFIPQPVEHNGWFRAKHNQQAQLKGDGRHWLYDLHNPPQYGFSFTPAPLSFPHMYSIQALQGFFDRRKQQWLSTRSPKAWFQTEDNFAFSVSVAGKLPKGTNILPVPLYSLDCASENKAIRLTENPYGMLMAHCKQATEFEYQVRVNKAPIFEGFEYTGRKPPELLVPTALDKELPLEVLEWLDELVYEALPPLQKAMAIRGFINQNYRYDPTYLEEPGFAAELQAYAQGSSNHHLAALHAGRDEHHLGAGICYDLGVLACEMLRRAGIPAGVAQGWTWEDGSLNEPDHMWAMALLPTKQGLKWLPIDPATEAGRPIRAGRRPQGPWRPKSTPQRKKPPAPPKWYNTRKPQRPPENRGRHRARTQTHSFYKPQDPGRSPQSFPKKAHSKPKSKPQRVQLPPPPVKEMIRVLEYLHQTADQPLQSSDLRQQSTAFLQNPRAARRLLKRLKAFREDG